MASDYAAITAENIIRRGTEFEDIGSFLAEKFYSDQTHFVYELLQNAQDALNRRSEAEPGKKFKQSVTFCLYPDRLEFRHHGQPFNEQDVRGISDILKGTKKGDKKQIGRFGIGFKSVYAFTRSPEVHSGDEHFIIRQYIRPESVPSREIAPDETLFVFPFDHPDKPSQGTFEKIEKRLAELGLRTLLFLDQIDQIVWEVNGKRKGAYIRDVRWIKDLDNCYYVHILGEEGAKKLEERWIIFDRHVNGLEGQDTTVEVAYLFKMDTKGEGYILKSDQSKLFAYFQTQIETHLGFLIQGHYNTTPARDNIQYDDEFNRSLIRETATLIVDSILQLRELKLLTARVLELMPLDEGNFPPSSYFRPLYDEVKRAFSTLLLLPSADGEYIKAEEAKLARGTELFELLNSEQMRQLFSTGREYKWLTDEITRDKTPELRQYLMGKLSIDEIDPEKFGRFITDKFLKSQSKGWLIKFYKYLDGQQALWQARSPYKEEGVLRQKPFVMLEDGEFVPPFKGNHPQVYLPSDEDTVFPVVNKTLMQNSQVAAFFRKLGLSEPDQVDEVLTYVLPKYPENGHPNISEQEHQKDIKKIFHTTEFCAPSKKDDFLRRVKSTKFLQAINAGTSKIVYQSPISIYIDNQELRDYFEGNPEIWFYDLKYIPYRKQLEALGVKKEIAVFPVRPERNGLVIITDFHGQHTRGLEGFDYRWNIEGLSYAVDHPTMKSARIIWNLILPCPQLIRGVVEISNRQDYQYPEKVDRRSKAGELVISSKWLPDRNGEFHLPSELSLDDLPNDFARNEKLASQLGMKVAAISALARDQGIDENTLNIFIQLYRRDPDLLHDTVSRMLQTRSISPEEAEFTYVEALQEAFEPPTGADQDIDPDRPNSPGPVPNPERRRKKTQEDIEQDKTHEPAVAERFSMVPSSVWEAKNSSIRPFLHEQYNGKCQICGFTFLKKNGEPYFEGLYLVSRLHKKWIDRIGNVLCLCANCCAKMQHGPVKFEDPLGQISSFRAKNEGGDANPTLIIELCGETVEIHYTESHIIDLQEMIKAERENDK